jgi:hypothetical protein
MFSTRKSRVATDGNLYGIMDVGGAQRRWDNLQNHAEWHPDHALQFLLSKWLP